MRPSPLAPIAALVLVAACTKHRAREPRDGARTAPARSPPAQTSVSTMPDAQPANASPAEPGDPKMEPPYDLSTDRQERMRVAKEQLGKRTITTIISDVFVLIAAPGWQGAQFDQS